MAKAEPVPESTIVPENELNPLPQDDDSGLKTDLSAIKGSPNTITHV